MACSYSASTSQLMFTHYLHRDCNVKSQRNPSDHHLCHSFFLQSFSTMATQQDHRRVPDLKFRVLIIGRANAGKTSILQRVCETTESPEIYRLGHGPRRTRYKVCSRF